MFLGIEIGGTKLQLALGPGDGTLRGQWRGPVDPAQGADGIRTQITGALPELLSTAGIDRSDLKGAGVGFGGPVDDATRTVIKSHQIHGWDNFPLADWIGDLVGLPTVLGNDADVAGLAEALFGAGKGLSPIFYITIGSGIGGGLIVNGEIYRGIGRGAAEIGHLRVWDEANHRSGIVEDFASGWAIGRAPGSFRDDVDAFWKSPEELARLTARDVVTAARSGNALARRILMDAWRNLARAICQVIALVCPRRIVIGGGMSLTGEEFLFAPLRQMVADRVFAPFADCCDIVPASLGEEVVLHGALALARAQADSPRGTGGSPVRNWPRNR